MAQFTYLMDQNIPVKDAAGNSIPMPWAGGLNSAQCNTLDLNDDGKMDLVLFDRMANKVLTYINTNNQYLYAPEYEFLFPTDVTNWILLRDFNCDGKKDIFTGDPLGVKVYTNITQPGGQLSWKRFLFFVAPGVPKSNVLLTKGFSLVNLQLQYDDLPAIIDADGDGDLDIFNMRYTGYSTVEYHQNFSKENYGTCDSLVFERITQTWGNFTECGCGKFAFNGALCSSLPGGRTEHAGGKSLLMLDVDSDQDLDLIFSEASCTNLYLLKNTGTTQNPIISSASTFPDTNPVNLVIFPAAYYEDVDFDGVNDLIASPNIYTKPGLNTNLAMSNWFYKNLGTQELPKPVFKKTNFMQDQMIDVGDNAVPAFADYDGDGDYDMFISENFTPSFRSKIYCYENIGSAEIPEFKLATDDYLRFSASSFYNLKIQFIDVTGDNRLDLVFTATEAQTQENNLYYITNTGNSSLNFAGQPAIVIDLKLKNGNDYKLYETDNIHVADLGQPDGLPDLLIGKSTGALEYWENTGSLNFQQSSTGFLGLEPSPLRQNISCAVGDLDGDDNTDLVLSDQSGTLGIISNVKKAIDISTALSDLILSPLQDSIYTTHNLGGRTWPAIVNLFKTDKPAIVLGNMLGGIHVLKNNNGQNQSEYPVIQIYPNPVAQSATLNIKVDRDGYMQVFSALGQQINEPIVLKKNEENLYSINALSKGIYFFRFRFNNQLYTKRIVIY